MVRIADRPIDSNPMPPAGFNSFSVRKLIAWYKRGRGPLNLEPEFQRQSVWNLAQRSKLLNSILHGYPLPAVVFYSRRDHKTGRIRYDVIDGKQRLETILLFLGEMRGEDRGFEAKFSHYEDGREFHLKRTWDEMFPKNRKRILSYEIPVVWVQGDMTEIREVFVRINSTGKALTSQEIRKAKYFKSPFLQEMTQLARRMKSRLMRMGVLAASEINRMKDVEFLSELTLSVLRGSVLDKKRALDQAMTPSGVDFRSLKRAMRDVEGAIKFVERVLPDICSTRFKKLADFYSLVFLFAKMATENALADKRAIKEAGYLLERFGALADKAYKSISEFDRDAEIDPRVLAYVQTVREGGDSAAHRREREAILKEILKGVFEEKDRHRLYTGVQRRIVWANSPRKKCCKCGVTLTWRTFEVDHIVPYSKGGKTVVGNGALICKSCNCRKGNRC